MDGQLESIPRHKSRFITNESFKNAHENAQLFLQFLTLLFVPFEERIRPMTLSIFLEESSSLFSDLSDFPFCSITLYMLWLLDDDDAGGFLFFDWPERCSKLAGQDEKEDEDRWPIRSGDRDFFTFLLRNSFRRLFLSKLFEGEILLHSSVSFWQPGLAHHSTGLVFVLRWQTHPFLACADHHHRFTFN